MQKVSHVTYLAVDELDIPGALRVAVSRTVLGSGLVVGVLGHATILVHGGEVEGAVETAGQVGHVDVEGELLVEELEHLVVGVVLHEVDTRADVGARHELERERGAGGRDTVRARVVRAVEGAVLRAGHAVGAEGSIPRVTGVAVRVARGGVEPAPVGVEDDFGVLSDTAAGGTLLGGKGGVRLRHLGADLLTGHHSEESETDEGGSTEHGGLDSTRDVQLECDRGRVVLYSRKFDNRVEEACRLLSEV